MSDLPFSFMCSGSLILPVILPQIMVRIVNLHKLPSVGTSVQATVVRVVVVGQLPQLNARML